MQKPAPIYSSELVLHPERDQDYVYFEQAATHPFQADPADFPRVNVWWLAEAALLSYSEPAVASAVFRDAGLDSEYLTEGSTDAYVAWRDDFVLVAFRGTEPDQWADVLADIRIAQVDWTSGHVHAGFKAALDVIWPKLSTALARLSGQRTVWFCGHSLGAALAILGADRYGHARGICTFGAPRVGSRQFASAFDAMAAGRSLRYVNNHDVVTHVPPPAIFPWMYEHVSARRSIAENGVVSAGELPLPHFFSDLIGSPEHLLEVIQLLDAQALRTPPAFLLDHMPKAYAIWVWNDYDTNG